MPIVQRARYDSRRPWPATRSNSGFNFGFSITLDPNRASLGRVGFDSCSAARSSLCYVESIAVDVKLLEACFAASLSSLNRAAPKNEHVALILADPATAVALGRLIGKCGQALRLRLFLRLLGQRVFRLYLRVLLNFKLLVLRKVCQDLPLRRTWEIDFVA